MAKLSNINGLFAVESTGAIKFNDQSGTSGQLLKSNGNTSPTWVDQSTIVGAYLPLAGGVLTGATSTASGISFTVGGALTVDGIGTFNTPSGGVAFNVDAFTDGYGVIRFRTNSNVSKWDVGINNSNHFYINNNGVNTALEIEEVSSNATFAGTISSKEISIKQQDDSGFDAGLTIERSANTQKVHIGMDGGAVNFNSPDGLSYKFRNNGTEKFTVDGSGNATFAGTVDAKGFRTTSGSTDYSLLTRNSTNTAVYIQQAGTGNIVDFRYGSQAAGQGTSAMFINASGNATFAGTGTFTSASSYVLTAKSTDTDAADIFRVVADDDGLVASVSKDASDNGELYVWSGAQAANIQLYGGTGNATFAGSVPTLRLDNTDTSLGVQTLGSLEFNQNDPSDQGVGVVAKINAVNESSFAGVAGLTFETGNATTLTERMRIDSSGRVGIGGPPTSTVRLSTRGLTNTNADFSFEAANSSGNSLFLVRSDGNVGIGSTAPLRKLHVEGATAIIHVQSTTVNQNASIWFNSNVGGTQENRWEIGTNISAGSDLEFFDRLNSVSRMVIQNDGNVGIGSISPTSKLLLEDTGTNSIVQVGFKNDAREYRLGVHGGVSDSFLLYDNTAGATRLEVDSSGNLGIGVTSDTSVRTFIKGKDTSTNNFQILTRNSADTNVFAARNDGTILFGTTSAANTYTYFVLDTGTASSQLNLGTSSTALQTLVNFRDSTNGVTGNVQSNSGGVSFNSISDYRLKENIVPMTGALDRVSQLKPSQYNLKKHKDNTVEGFIAHELQEVYSQAVSGEKDKVNDKGEPQYQFVDNSKLVPLLVGAIQELKTEIEILKNK